MKRVGRVRFEVVLAAQTARDRLANLVHGTQVKHHRRLRLENDVTQRTDELQQQQFQQHCDLLLILTHQQLATCAQINHILIG